MSTLEITSKIRELKELKAYAEQIASEITALEDVIKAEMLERDTEEITVDVYKVRYAIVKSNRFDATSFKREYSDLYEQFLKSSESRRFTIA